MKIYHMKIFDIKQAMLCFFLDEFFTTGKQLTHTFLPLSTVAHLIVLIKLLQNGFAIQTIRMHFQNLYSPLKKRFLLVLLVTFFEFA